MEKMKTPIIVLMLSMFFVAGCVTDGGPVGSSSPSSSRRVRVITPQGIMPRIEWSAEDQAKEVASRSIRVTRSAGYSVVRVRTAEKPHVHDRTDLLVTVLSGQARMHLAGHHIDVSPGDVIEIPRGVVHWAENIGKQPCEAFVVSTPPFQGDDVRLIEVGGR